MEEIDETKTAKYNANKAYYWKVKSSGKCKYSFCEEPREGNSPLCKKHREERNLLVGKRYRRDPITKEVIVVEQDGQEHPLGEAPSVIQKPRVVPQERGLLSSTDKLEEIQALFKKREVLKAKLEEYSCLKLELSECEKAIISRLV